MSEMSSCLSEQYEEKVRPCIDLIDSLRAHGVEQDLALSAIAVIGDQSSGKSSVLEALSGVALPHGSGETPGGITTRCPLELKMTKIRKEDFWHGKLQYNDYDKEIKDPADLEKMIQKAQNEIAGAVGISDKLISLQVTSSNVPDLVLIDLPGIICEPVKGQPKDIKKQSKRVIRKFISNPGTIILVVLPCNVDIATSEALKMAQEVDPNGKRTLGILTKPDLVDRGTEDRVVSIVNNEVIYLSKGYMIVKCRGQQDITNRVSLQDATEMEKDFFKNHAYFSELYNERKATIPELAEKLMLELILHIKPSLPQLEEQIRIKLAETQAQLNLYCSGPPKEPEQRLCFLLDKITAFTQDAINLAIGEGLESIPHVNIFSDLRRQFDDWKNFLDHSALRFNEDVEKKLQEYEELYRGRELPGFFNYKTFEIIVKDQIKQLEETAVKTLKKISDLVRKEFIRLAQSNFLAFPNLFKIAKTRIETIKRIKESEAESILRTQFKMELLIYTQDSIYRENLNLVMQKEEITERLVYGVSRPISSSLYNNSDIEDTLENLTYHLKSYYSVVRKRLADQVPLVIKYMLLQESAMQLQREMLQLRQDENIDVLLKEDDETNSKRNALESLQKRLVNAYKYLVMF